MSLCVCVFLGGPSWFKRETNRKATICRSISGGIILTVSGVIKARSPGDFDNGKSTGSVTWVVMKRSHPYSCVKWCDASFEFSHPLYFCQESWRVGIPQTDISSHLPGDDVRRAASRAHGLWRAHLHGSAHHLRRAPHHVSWPGLRAHFLFSCFFFGLCFLSFCGFHAFFLLNRHNVVAVTFLLAFCFFPFIVCFPTSKNHIFGFVWFPPVSP